MRHFIFVTAGRRWLPARGAVGLLADELLPTLSDKMSAEQVTKAKRLYTDLKYQINTRDQVVPW